MSYGELPLMWYTEQDRDIPTYSFIPEGGWDDDDYAAVRLASDRAYIQYLEAENQRMRSLVAAYVDILNKTGE